MKIKTDEDLPWAAAKLLRQRGYECDTVLEEQLGGTKDPQLWPLVQAHGRFLVTADKGFANVRQFPPGAHRGVLMLRPNEDGIRPIPDLLEAVLAQIDLKSLAGTIAAATPKGLRVRRGDRSRQVRTRPAPGSP